ncbi:hypothetical protein CWI38_1733p0030 [Hamiltosporidium tvaerminnensis]|uniref:Uncharacterized protein n=1 Tax=Hamiltosporidium tvaerminnensis TaxID=1176355 RepID=A0A4Q9LPV4_9MICR|nr:hypothetical protein CWI38_1733p0030 [Hamiltosporidium tvaerminnensis]
MFFKFILISNFLSEYFRGVEGVCQHCNPPRKTVYCLATRCEKMYGKAMLDGIIKLYMHTLTPIKKISFYLRMDTRIKSDEKNKITLIEVGITSQALLQTVETEKLRKYALLANYLEDGQNNSFDRPRGFIKLISFVNNSINQHPL